MIEYKCICGEVYTKKYPREKIAEYAHDTWSGWMRYLFDTTTPYKPGETQAEKGALIIPKWAVDRWKRQMSMSYKGLSDIEKESDLKEADDILAVISKE